MIVISINAHCRDCFSLVAYDDPDPDAEWSEVDTLRIYEGYVPESSLGGGDDVILRIDNATGRIIGWVPIDLEVLGEETKVND